MGGAIDFNNDESIRLYCLDLRNRVIEKTGVPCEILAGLCDTKVLVIFNSDHTFKMSETNRIEKKRGKTIQYDSIEEWENEIIETTKLYRQSGNQRGGNHILDPLTYWS